MRRIVVVLAAAAGLVALPACGNRTNEAARAAGMTPTNAVAFVSASLDPSIAQKKDLLDIARKFPKARDKVRKDFNESKEALLSDAVKSACLDFQRDVKPWLGSEVAIAALPRPSSKGVEGVVFIKVKDESKAQKALTTAAAEPCKSDAQKASGTKPQFRIIKGFAVITSAEKPSDSTTLLDDIDRQSKAGDGGLAKTEAFTRLEAKLHGDRLVFGFVDTKGILDATGSTPKAGCNPAAALGSGGSMAFDLHLGSASVVLEGVGDAPATALKAGAPTLTQGLPGDSTGSFTMFDVASIVRTALDCTGNKDEVQGQLADQTGLDLETDILSWMGGEAVVMAGPFTAGKNIPDFALLVHPTDQQKASAAVDKLKSKLTDQGGSLQEIDVNGTKGFTVAQERSSSSSIQPAMVLLPDRFILATSPAFLKELATSATGGSSFGQNGSYRAVVGDGSGDGTNAQLVVRVSAVKDAIVKNLSPRERQEYDKNVAPQLDPIDAFGFRTFEQGGLSHIEMKLTLK